MGDKITSIKGTDLNPAAAISTSRSARPTPSGDIKACERGFHACPIEHHPLSVFEYYPPGQSRFWEVAQSGERSEKCNKLASAEITISVEISIGDLVKRAWDYVWSRAEKATGTTPPAIRARPLPPAWQGAASATGEQGAPCHRRSGRGLCHRAIGARPLPPATWGAASATGDQGAASATGHQGAALCHRRRARPLPPAISGAASATGDQGAASATGYQGAASATGYQGAASATGDRGAASATGARGAASATGDWGAASATGTRARPLPPAPGAALPPASGARPLPPARGAATASGYEGRVMGRDGNALSRSSATTDATSCPWRPGSSAKTASRPTLGIFARAASWWRRSHEPRSVSRLSAPRVAPRRRGHTICEITRRTRHIRQSRSPASSVGDQRRPRADGFA